MKPYPQYKDSGVEWIGEVPEEWSVKKLKYIFSLVTEKDSGGNRKIALENIESQTGRFIETDTLFEGEGVKIRINDLLYGKLRPYLAKVYLASFEGSAVGDFFVLRGCLEICSKFFLYKLLERNFTNLADSSTFGAKMPRVSWEFLSDMIFSCPSLSEQTAIAAFLDRKTAEIDSIIAKKERLIELYEEEKAAVINHAVTKGLDPDAKMKDSGIEWLGEIPEHWEVIRTKRAFKLVTDRAPDDNNLELLSIYTEIGVMPRKELEARGNNATTTDGYWVVEKGDLIVNKLLAWMGAIGISEYNGVTSPAYDILRAKMSLEPKFFHYLFRTKVAQSEFKRWSRGIMEMRLRLYFDEFGGINIPFPSVEEQTAIVQHIETKCSHIDAIISKFKRQIELLKEYRTALISEAVTGKIDLRHEI